ncbi:MAG: ribosomal L7Ae/L30e/S12e/Gadd45 family protein [Lachnospiraceae bacterium]|nr:ribosomal L7Ae/L30e/S12e/Gadd45 family protein [Lachnospiraceae bacterium]
MKNNGLDPVLSMIGLANKAGAVKSGRLMIESSIKSESARLIIIAGDASEGTAKKINDMCSYRNVPAVTYSTKEMLGRCVGKDLRSALAVTDENLAKAILSKMPD